MLKIFGYLFFNHKFFLKRHIMSLMRISPEGVYEGKVKKISLMKGLISRKTVKAIAKNTMYILKTLKLYARSLLLKK